MSAISFSVIGYEATASGRADMVTLVGQLHDLKSLPTREPGATYDEALVLDAALKAMNGPPNLDEIALDR